jgi:hypothetical protein
MGAVKKIKTPTHFKSPSYTWEALTKAEGRRWEAEGGKGKAYN